MRGTAREVVSGRTRSKYFNLRDMSLLHSNWGMFRQNTDINPLKKGTMLWSNPGKKEMFIKRRELDWHGAESYLFGETVPGSEALICNCPHLWHSGLWDPIALTLFRKPFQEWWGWQMGTLVVGSRWGIKMMHTRVHSHKKFNESAFKGSIIFSKTIVELSCSARKQKKLFSMKVTAVIVPNVVRDFAVHKVIIFLLVGL